MLAKDGFQNVRLKQVWIALQVFGGQILKAPAGNAQPPFEVVHMTGAIRKHASADRLAAPSYLIQHQSRREASCINMNVYKTVRSWSFPPPAYFEIPQENDQTTPPSSAQPHRTMSSRSHCSAWIMSFDRQWLLAHVLAIFSCFVTMAVGTIIFVTSDFDTGINNIKHSWLAGVAGMVTSALNFFALSTLQRVSRPNNAQTLEQQSTNRFLATIGAVLLEISAAVAQGAISHATVVTSASMGVVRLAARVAV